MYRVGFGMLNLSPDVFWGSAPQELYHMAKGYAFREEKIWERTAWQTAHLMNATGNFKKKITIKTLLGSTLNTKNNHIDKETEANELRALSAEMEKRVNRGF